VCTGVILLQNKLLVWVELEEREELIHCRADVLGLNHQYISSTVAGRIKFKTKIYASSHSVSSHEPPMPESYLIPEPWMSKVTRRTS